MFYRLLLDAAPELGYRMKAGQIDFVEPNDRGIFKKEAFEVSEAQVGELRETVGRVIREIRDFAFWNKECGEKGCRWCGVRGGNRSVTIFLCLKRNWKSYIQTKR